MKTIESFDFSFQPSIEEGLIRELAELFFIEKAENILFLGPPGVGKTHLAIALGFKACEARKRVLFAQAVTFMDELMASVIDHSIGTRLGTLGRLDLLIIDELGYMPMEKQKANLFFQLVSKCYERGSIILTSNKSFDQWGEVFGDEVIASAILDRLLHHSYIIPINGPSYRTKDKSNHTIVRLFFLDFVITTSIKMSYKGKWLLSISNPLYILVIPFSIRTRKE